MMIEGTVGDVINTMAYFCERIEKMAAYVPGEQPTDPAVVKINTTKTLTRRRQP